MKTPISYYGGKQSMLKDILPLIPEHNTYTESFAGGAAVLFAKAPVKINVINDLNGELLNFYRTTATHYKELKQEIDQTLHSREQFDVARFIYNHPDYFSEVKRAWAVWVISKEGFSGDLSSAFAYSKTIRNQKAVKAAYGKQAFGEELRELLERCTIEQDDALKVIARYDSPETFHFVDPPYVGCVMGHYEGMFDNESLSRLLDLLSGIQGKFMLTMYPNDKIREYAERCSWIIHRLERRVSASNSAKVKQRKQEEWIVCNYIKE